MKIFVSGSLAYDKIMNFPGYFKDHILPDKIHTLNVSFIVEHLEENFGGTAGNIAYNLALLGEEPIILSSAGNDFENYKAWLEKYGVDVSQVQILKDEKTAFANILTDQADNQLTAFYPGAMGCDYDSSIVDGELAIIAPGNIKEMQDLPSRFRDKNIPFIFDPGQQIPILNANDLQNGIKGSKALISNDYELSLIMKKTGWNEKQILNNTEILVSTLGKKGSRIKIKKMSYDIPAAQPKNTSDPTGAGDAYRAGFIKGLIKKWPLDIVGRFAGVVSCYTVEKYGTQTHKFNFQEAMKRYKENFGEIKL